MKKRRWIIALIVLVMFITIIVGYRVGVKNGFDEKIADNKTTNEKSYCKIDSDCVPDLCCHAKGCVNKENAPNCREIMCTMECREGTLDCGYGKCECINNKCVAVFKNE
ncbi:MAG: hypothetical protein N3D20_01775 [Candidatus Pacearchaeota archaeon]|nr:hypothetical protein [Candidatus Pacearchaeota archaeon]